MFKGRTRPYTDLGPGNALCKRCGIPRKQHTGGRRTTQTGYCADCYFPAQQDGWVPPRKTR